jgi:branched-chain amino acid transport system substrate-binding protein
MLARQKLVFGLGVVVLVALITVLLVLRGTKEPGDIKIGALLPLTGSAAQYGTWAKNGAELAEKEINEKGGIHGKELKILFEDSRSDPKEGVSALNKLISVNRVQVVIIEFSGLVLAAAPIAEEKKLVLLNVGALNPQIRKAGDYVFSNINDANVEAYQLARYTYNELRLRRVALLYATASYGVGNRDAFRHRFTELGGEIVADESLEENSGDFRTQLLKVKAAGPDGIFLSAVTKDAALVLKQAKELGAKAQWLSTAFFEGPDLIEVAGDAAEGAIYTTTVLDESSANPAVQRFIASYKQEYGVEPEIYAATAYDGVKILARAIATVGYDGTRIKDFLYTVKDYPGVSGLTTFDSDGAVEKPVLFKTVSNGKFRILDRDW